MEKILNYINGELADPISNQYLKNINPALGEVYSQIADSDEQAYGIVSVTLSGVSNV